MSKNENTLLALDAALVRIIQGQPKRIPKTRRLSVRAVEEEANLGNGSCYYYPDFVQKIRDTQAKLLSKSSIGHRMDSEQLRNKIKNEHRIKEDYKQKNIELQSRIAQMAAEHHVLNNQLRIALSKADALSFEVQGLKNELAAAKREVISIFNKEPP